MGRRQAIEVDEEAVPRPFVDVAVLQRLKCQVRGAPGKCRDDITVLLEDVKGCALLATGQV